MKKQARQIFWNAMLLSAAALLMRTVGVGFRVYVSGKVGAEAMGLFSLMSGVYGFALTLATSGIHLGVTHIIVGAVERGHRERVAPAMRRAVLLSLFCGLFSSILLFCGADFIGNTWLRDARTVTSLRLFSITLPLISLSSAFGGYLTAVRRVYKNAAVQVLEQMLKILFTMYLLAALSGGGVERTCCALVLGGTLAEVGSFFLELILYLIDRRRSFPEQLRSGGAEEGRHLVRITLPIALTTYIRSALVTCQHILIPQGLRQSGASHAQALIVYGCIQSMVLPIILYPAAFISSFSGLLVPELAAASVGEHPKRIRYMIGRVWSLSILFSIGVGGILVCFSSELGALLYPNTAAGHYIRILAPLIPIMYIDTATDAMMKGMGEQLFSMKINIADALISVILVILLIPRYGITGYLIAIYFSELFNTVMSITHLLSIGKPGVRLLKWVYKPLLCIVGATCTGRLILARIASGALSGLHVTLHCLLVLLLYIALLFLFGCIDREDRSWVASLFVKETDA